MAVDGDTLTLDYLEPVMDTNQTFYCFPLEKDISPDVPISDCYLLKNVQYAVDIYKCHQRGGFIIPKCELFNANNYFKS